MNLLNYTFKISSNSFFQVNTEQTNNLYNKVIEYVKQEDNPTLLDLYCGVGTISCAVSKYCKKVIGIEVVKEAIINAEENIKINNINNIEFVNNKVENVIDSIKDSMDVVILDPPRSGSDTKTLNTIKDISPKTIIYVSCEPTTLARDLIILSGKYNVIEVTPFDMFPNTNHVETIVLLKRKI
jgi:23S rRNA (uracil1939-C5)-methyltransferase